MYDIQTNSNLRNLIADKRVVVIGPSPHLKECGAGPLFDEYDIVCRINDVIPLYELRPDYGSRTDILFHNMSDQGMPGLREKIAYKDARQYWENLKLVMCPSIKSIGSQSDYLQWPDNTVSAVVKNFESVNESGIPFYWLGVKDYKKLWSAIGTEPNCGMLAIMILLSYPIKELLVTGFSFFAQGAGQYDVYCEGHWPDAVPKPAAFGGGHPQESQRRVFKDLCVSTAQLKVDSFLNEVLAINHSNVLNLK